MELIDSHCHIHESSYMLPKDVVRSDADKLGIKRVICVGTDQTTSLEAVKYAQSQDNTWASVGLHPHDAKLGGAAFASIESLFPNNKIIAIGECGLDYYYNYSDKKEQFMALEVQMQLALDKNIPMIFHIRDAFDDFWPIYDNFSHINGVVHSFTATTNELEKILTRDLLVGINGIITFTKDRAQLEAAKAIPLDALLLETDAPFLTPVPQRGKVNEPKNIRLIAEFLAELRGEDVAELASATTKNACQLFGI